MSFEMFVALRYLVSRRKQTFISIISLMSVLGVAIGVAALVVVLGVYNGFTTDIRDKIVGANAHILVLSQGLQGLESNEDVLDKITALPGVVAATPFIYSEVMLSAATGVKGLILRGIDPENGAKTLSILQNMYAGSLINLDATGEGSLPGIIIGKELADRLGLAVGSRLNLLSPTGQRTSAGFTPKVSAFRVCGIFKAGMAEYDSSLGFISLDAAEKLLGLPPGRISGIEVRVEDVSKADTIATAINSTLGASYNARDWMAMNANLFAALQLEKIGMFIVLAMVVLVGSFSIITSLVMLVMEKTRDIAIMMSMGATAGSIRRIFMLQGTVIGIFGTALGYVMGLALAWALRKYQFIKLPHGVYTMDHLPILVRFDDTAIIGVASMLMCFLATIYPARQAASLTPATALRYE